MDCNIYKEHNYCTTHCYTVFPIEYTIDEATEEWELEIKLKSKQGKEEVWDVCTVETVGKLARINPQTWMIKKRQEHLPPGTYDYHINYKIGNTKRIIIKGTITVNP